MHIDELCNHNSLLCIVYFLHVCVSLCVWVCLCIYNFTLINYMCFPMYPSAVYTQE